MTDIVNELRDYLPEYSEPQIVECFLNLLGSGDRLGQNFDIMLGIDPQNQNTGRVAISLLRFERCKQSMYYLTGWSYECCE